LRFGVEVQRARHFGEESPFRRALFAARFPFGGSGASAWLPHGRRHYRRIRNGEASAEAIRVVGR
jgi:hypothetical protein